MKKICSTCKIEKDINEFSNNKNKKDGKQLSCKNCCKSQQKKCYYKDKSKYFNRSKIQRNKTQDFIIEYKKERCCEKCNEKRYYILDFHHIEHKTKSDNIGDLSSSGNFNQLKNEIEKCILLCKNCHYEFHHFEKINKITIQEYLK